VEVDLRSDVLNPGTEWSWPLGPPEVRLPGGSLDALALALAAGDSGAQLSYRTWGYVLEWEDRPPEQENEDVARAMRCYRLTYLLQNRAGMEADDQRTRCGPFVEGVALTREGQGADLAEADHRNLRDAIFRLLDKAGAALDVIG
jgi:hypothetical protein